MAFTTWIYGIFLILSVAIYWLTPKSFKEYYLLTVSLMFVLYASPFTAMLLFGLGTLVYLLGGRNMGKKTLLITGLVILLSVLIYFKYVVLIDEVLRKLLPWAGVSLKISVPAFALPLGISYFTFKLIHYLVDSYRGTRPHGGYRSFLLYIFFFPILPLGPIERWPNFLREARQLNGFKWEYLTEGLTRIILGLFKKLVLADAFAIFSEKLTTQGLSSTAYWFIIYSYALRIYFDFSGYSDIAIGSARLFGYRIIENFNNPYFKSNLSLFWKNWHMSLTGWFRDYVFIPLGGSRGSFARTLLNSFIVMSLTGIWHGASLNFLTWGLYHAVGLTLLRLYNKIVSPRLPGFWRDSKLSAGFGTLLTFHFVVVGWVFFATDFNQSLYVVSKLFFRG